MDVYMYLYMYMWTRDVGVAHRLQEEIERQHGLNDSLLEGAGGSAHDSSLEHERDADDDNRAEVRLTPPVLVVATCCYQR